MNIPSGISGGRNMCLCCFCCCCAAKVSINNLRLWKKREANGQKHKRHLSVGVEAGCPTHAVTSRTLHVGAPQLFFALACRLLSHSTGPQGPSQDLIAQHDPAGSAWRRPVQPHGPTGDGQTHRERDVGVVRRSFSSY